MVKLQVYVTENCWTCTESRHIASEIANEFPQVNVELLDMTHEKRPDNVFAVPTFLLNGRVVSLGNPHRHVLKQKIQAEISHPPVNCQ
ncbi:MAG: thioredoxin family protein [Methylococcales bacterium]|nr:thioredoxin family protein [Methylococcales bacterium]